jgi:hypothetical protein
MPIDEPGNSESVSPDAKPSEKSEGVSPEMKPSILKIITQNQCHDREWLKIVAPLSKEMRDTAHQADTIASMDKLSNAFGEAATEAKIERYETQQAALIKSVGGFLQAQSEQASKIRVLDLQNSIQDRRLKGQICSLRRFEQREGDCAGYVAAWIRCRAKGWDDFWNLYFRRDAKKGYSVNNKGTAKIKSLMQFEQEASEKAQSQNGDINNNNKSKKFDKGQWKRDYICFGSEPKTEALLTCSSLSSPVFVNGGQGISDIIRYYDSEYGLLSVTGHGNHAISFDRTIGGRVYYFDPNFGEVFFNKTNEFCDWIEKNWDSFNYPYQTVDVDTYKHIRK